VPRSRSAVASVAIRLAPIALVGLSWAGPSPTARAQAPARPARSFDEPTPIASTRPTGPSGTVDARTGSVLRAAARWDGIASPGLKVTLDGSASSGGKVWYRWIQTQGPRVAIDDPMKAEAHFTVPADAASLGFVLVVGDPTGVDARAVTIEVDDPERDSDAQVLKADAGDDQAARVGRKVVLNGIRSAPRGKIRFRWIQAGGPRVALQAGDGPTSSFLPTVPGTYRFALVVATTGGILSEASMVTVNVAGAGSASGRASAGPPGAAEMAIDELARVSVASIEGGTRYADDLSRAFDAVADRMDKFKSYDEANAEMTRRLDAVVPRDKGRRAVWIEQFFSPLMAKVVAGMRPEGLDLTQADAPAKPMTRAQRARLAEQYRFTAAGLRASRALR